MLKVLTLIGARPQFIKASAISRAIKNSFSSELEELIVHSGQHYDVNMSQVFFDELEIPKPAYVFDLNRRGHAAQTSEILVKLEEVVLREKPDALLVYGDTNTTLAGAMVASKLHIPLIHIEAGLRSFNKAMPEEINRVLTDHCSSLLFCPTQTAVDNLASESIVHHHGQCTIDTPKVFSCGDIMYDNSMFFSQYSKNEYLNKHDLIPSEFILCTVHRPVNTDDRDRLESICKGLMRLSEEHKQCIAFPMHPRTKSAIENSFDIDFVKKFLNHKHIKILQPASFIEMIALEKNCKMVITDSGGVQKEAYFFNKPAIILRSETEWVEIVSQGAAKLVDANPAAILDAYAYYNKSNDLCFPTIFGDGRSAEFICNKIVEELK